jgi:hypothetical protein
MSGFMYFVFVLLSTCIGNYEGFKKETNLMNRFYSTDDCVNNKEIGKKVEERKAHKDDGYGNHREEKL